MKEYGVYYDRLWIYDKIHHEINQFCSRHTLQEVYIDKFDRVSMQQNFLFIAKSGSAVYAVWGAMIEESFLY